MWRNWRNQSSILMKANREMKQIRSVTINKIYQQGGQKRNKWDFSKDWGKIIVSLEFQHQPQFSKSKSEIIILEKQYGKNLPSTNPVRLQKNEYQ